MARISEKIALESGITAAHPDWSITFFPCPDHWLEVHSLESWEGWNAAHPQLSGSVVGRSAKGAEDAKADAIWRHNSDHIGRLHREAMKCSYETLRKAALHFDDDCASSHLDLKDAARAWRDNGGS